MNNDVPEVASYSMAIIKVVIAKLRVLANYMKEKKLCNQIPAWSHLRRHKWTGHQLTKVQF